MSFVLTLSNLTNQNKTKVNSQCGYKKKIGHKSSNNAPKKWGKKYRIQKYVFINIIGLMMKNSKVKMKKKKTDIKWLKKTLTQKDELNCFTSGLRNEAYFSFSFSMMMKRRNQFNILWLIDVCVCVCACLCLYECETN